VVYLFGKNTTSEASKYRSAYAQCKITNVIVESTKLTKSVDGVRMQIEQEFLKCMVHYDSRTTDIVEFGSLGWRLSTK